MEILLLIHAFIALALIGIILLQKSEGSGLGLGGGGASGSLFSVRGSANFLTRVTAVLAVIFFGNCLLMSIVTNVQVKQSEHVLESPIEKK